MAAIFYLPTLVQTAPAMSASYNFGYNNQVGVVLVLLLVAIGAVLNQRSESATMHTRSFSICSSENPYRALIAVLLGCLVMVVFAGRLGGFGESTYFIDRAWMLSQGRIPYVDFEWAYGVSFLYVPDLLHHLLHLDIVQAYYLFWVFNFLLGTVLLFSVVNMVDYPTKSKQTIFLLLYGSSFLSIVCMGINYTYLRFTCPLFFILVVHKLLNRSGSKSRVYAALLSVAFTIILLLISPEIALAHAFACVCLFLLPAPGRNGRFLAVFAGLLLALMVVFCTALKLHVLDSIKVNGKGADSFPVIFAPHILLFFAALFVCACYVFRRCLERSIQDNTIGLIAFSVPMLAAALGRCDPGHVLVNGEGVFLASMFYVSNYKAAWKLYKTAFVVFLIIIQSYSGMSLYVPLLKQVGKIVLGESNSNSIIIRSITYIGRQSITKFGSASKQAMLKAVIANPPLVYTDRVDLNSLYPLWHGTFLAPYGYRPNGFGTYLSNQVDYGHYEGFENANSLDAIHVKLAEIKSHPEKALLLPEHFEDICHFNSPLEKHVIGDLFDFPFIGRAVHPNSICQPICDYILARYRLLQEPTPQYFGYGLWIVKPVEAPR